MNTLALAVYLYAGSIVALFLWFDLLVEPATRNTRLWHRLAWCGFMTITWPIWGLIAVGRAWTIARQVRP